jgi:hypothetical protein
MTTTIDNDAMMNTTSSINADAAITTTTKGRKSQKVLGVLQHSTRAQSHPQNLLC